MKLNSNPILIEKIIKNLNILLETKQV